MSEYLAFFTLPGGWEIPLILVVGLLLFGRRLPEIARSVGKSVVEFKRGLKDVKDEIDVSAGPSDPNMLPPTEPKPDAGPTDSSAS